VMQGRAAHGGRERLPRLVERSRISQELVPQDNEKRPGENAGPFLTPVKLCPPKMRKLYWI
jgi:hypothetical protein